MGFELVGQVWDPQGFREFVGAQDLGWASGVTMHHTAAPSLAQRPRGLTIQHIRNIQNYYQSQLGWSSGPHLFIDDDQIFGMSSLERRGIHAVSFNRTHIGIEVLGNYDSEPPGSGRGAACWGTAVSAVQILLARMGKGPEVVNGHRDDPRTSKSCPGSLVDLDEFRARLSVEEGQEEISDRVDPDREELLKIAENLQWQLDKLKKLIQ